MIPLRFQRHAAFREGRAAPRAVRPLAVLTLRAPIFRIALLAFGLLFLGCWNAFGLGSDYRNDETAMNDAWPKGMTNLVNIKNRIHGFFVNDTDIFFYSGSAPDLSAFLGNYSKIQGTVDKHVLLLHEGTGEARSPWDKTGRPCDWELEGSSGWASGKAAHYKLVAHFWTGGKIHLDQVTIPANVEVKRVK